MSPKPNTDERYPIRVPKKGGKEFLLRKPKTAIVMASTQRGEDTGAFMQDVRNIIKMMFTKADAEVINQRLWEDPDDDLDVGDIFQAVQDVTEAATGNPTS